MHTNSDHCFYQMIVPSSPNDTILNITGTTFVVSWNMVNGADEYEVLVHQRDTEDLVGGTKLLVYITLQ